MPKLSTQMAEIVQKSEGNTGDFPLIEVGRYFAQLAKVDVVDGSHGGVRWTGEFQNITDASGNSVSGRQWYNLNLPVAGVMPATYTNGEDKWEKYQAVSAARLKSFFEAFGYTSDSDTDEMIGESAVIDIEVRTIQNGPRRGELVNGIKNVLPTSKLESGKSTTEEGTF